MTHARRSLERASHTPATPASRSGHAFDRIAHRYDADFTETLIGRVLRQRLWRHLDAQFSRGDRIVDIGCGTGADRSHLTRRGVDVIASDPSLAMLRVAEHTDQGTTGLVCMRAITGLGGEAVFDGAISSFGALNCIDDIAAFGQELARLVRPGGRVVLVPMGRWCLWEMAWYTFQLAPGRAFRRLMPTPTANVGGVTFPLVYPTPGQLANGLGLAFRLLEVAPLGAVLPPTYIARHFERRPWSLRLLERLEEHAAAVPAAAWIADHYVAVFERSVHRESAAAPFLAAEREPAASGQSS